MENNNKVDKYQRIIVLVLLMIVIIPAIILNTVDISPHKLIIQDDIIKVGVKSFKVEDINYKNVELLKNFMNDKGKISPARVTGLEAKVQRKIAKAIKRARQIALMPYTKIEK